MRIGCAVLLAFVILSCDVKPKTISEKEAYFNIEELLKKEIEYLLEQKAGLEKTVVSNSNQERIVTKPTSKEDWEAQLSLFIEANISKPGLRGAYFEESLTTLEGLNKTIYSAKTSKTAVQTFECFYRNDVLAQINILMAERNSIFKSTKELSLYFNSSGDHIVGFDVSGEEKMQLKDDLKFEIKAVVTY